MIQKLLLLTSHDSCSWKSVLASRIPFLNCVSEVIWNAQAVTHLPGQPSVGSLASRGTHAENAHQTAARSLCSPGLQPWALPGPLPCWLCHPVGAVQSSILLNADMKNLAPIFIFLHLTHSTFQKQKGLRLFWQHRREERESPSEEKFFKGPLSVLCYLSFISPLKTTPLNKVA